MQVPLSQRHAFLSYMHEDKKQVDELQESLEAMGVQVWRDTKDLWPGEDWEAKIRAAIKADSLAFVACFSTAAEAREKSYQYEELTLAVDEYRLRRPNTSWLFTVRFDDCAIPEFNLGGGRTLESTIQRTDLFGESKTVQTVRLSQAIARVVNPPSAPTVTTEVVAEAKRASSSGRDRSDSMKILLRDSSADIAIEDFVTSIASGIRDQLKDEVRFPSSTQETDWWPFSEIWIAQLRAYDKAIEPAMDMVRLAAMYGQPQHNRAWERFMRTMTAHVRMDAGNTALLNLRPYPSLVLMYIAAIASTSRRNFGPLISFVISPSVRDKYDAEQRVPVLLVTNVRAVAQNLDAIASALAMSDDGRAVDEELIDGLVAKRIGNRHTPMSDHLHSLLRDLFRDELEDEDEYADVFDRAEVLLDALAYDTAKQSERSPGWRGGYGRYTWRHRDHRNPVEVRMLKELNEQRDGWGPVLDGLFGGSVDRAVEALEYVASTAKDIRSRVW